MNQLQIYNDAQEALDTLRDELPRKPALVLLDINLPGTMDGTQLLESIKQDEDLKRTPIVMLTTTDDPREVRRCYDLGCNLYVTKPVNFADFQEVIRRVGLFLGVVQVARDGQ